VTDPAYSNTFGVKHANILISISQLSETCCILMIPFFMKRFGIKVVMLISMFAWVFRFGFFAIGNPGFPGVIWFILSMIVYGVAFDFFNISGSLYVNRKTTVDIRSSAQGLFMLMTNGMGATFGSLGAQAVVNHYTHAQEYMGNIYTVGDWQHVWLIFSAYALVIGIAFIFAFRNPGKDTPEMDPDNAQSAA
jgi:NHS family nucleoside permease-like MFS transporter